MLSGTSYFSCELWLGRFILTATDSTGQRSNPRRHRDKVYVGCGAGFGGDRPMAALKLLQRVKELNYLVLECLAERTLADRYRILVSGGKGYDPRGIFLTCVASNALDSILAQWR